MELASHELHELSELIASCFNTVTCMGTFINQAQDPQLKALLQRHYPKHIEDYNLKVEFVQNASTPDISKFQPDPLTPKLNNYTQTPGNLAQATAPRTNAQTHNDREIATSYLLNQKAAAKNYAAAALECANPALRTFLENAFLNSSCHSYEIWEYMMEKGYYPLTPATSEAIQTVGSLYQPVQQFPYMGDSANMPQQQHLQ